MRIQLQYRWKDLIRKDGNLYHFPCQRRNVERKLLEVSGIYRWIRVTPRKKVCLYLGESGNLYNRLYGYLHRSKSQATSYRIGRELKKQLKKGGQIGFQLLILLPSRFAGENISSISLESTHLRKAIEQTLIFRENRLGGCKLNKTKSNRGNVK